MYLRIKPPKTFNGNKTNVTLSYFKKKLKWISERNEILFFFYFAPIAYSRLTKLQICTLSTIRLHTFYSTGGHFIVRKNNLIVTRLRSVPHTNTSPSLAMKQPRRGYPICGDFEFVLAFSYPAMKGLLKTFFWYMHIMFPNKRL